MSIAINGMGRIGTQLLRAFAERGEIDEVVAINDPFFSPEQLAYKIKYDSVHGKFNGVVEARGNSLVVSGREIPFFREKEIEKLPWVKYEGVVVAECSGKLKDRESAARHLRSGARKVVVSSPIKGADKTIVLGINDYEYDPERHMVVSNASCTTNCLTPLVHLIDMQYRITGGTMATIHAYTNDQRIHDGMHDDLRRARAAGVNIIPTSTGAESALVEALPKNSFFRALLLEDKTAYRKGRLSAISHRVPVITGSLVDLTVDLEIQPTVEQVNKIFYDASQSNRLRSVLAYARDPIVSSDSINDGHSAVFDSLLTTRTMKGVRVFAWYDNEFGYTQRLADLCGRV